MYGVSGGVDIINVRNKYEPWTLFRWVCPDCAPVFSHLSSLLYILGGCMDKLLGQCAQFQKD